MGIRESTPKPGKIISSGNAKLLVENFSSELYLTTIKAMAHYLKSREPWEDYDICIFDSSFDWCLAISHEDRYVWVTKDE
jgi:hypothetical protein